MDLKTIEASAELRCKFVQTTTACTTEDINKAVYNIFDEFQLSLSEKEILHPSEECHRQRWLASESEIFDVVNKYHIICLLCKKHFYSRSVPTDINSFFQGHINTEYHREFRELPFSRSMDIFTWEEKWRTGRCNVCQMSGLVAFVKDINYSLMLLFLDHCCVFKFTLQGNNQGFLGKMSLLKKYCQLSIFRDKFIKPLNEGSACLICCSKIPWSGENVKIHLGSPSHMDRFFWLVRNRHNLSPKDLLNGFNLEMVTRWVYCSTVKSKEDLESDYEKKRLECYLASTNTLGSDRSSSSGHYCPEVIEKLLSCQTSDSTLGRMCLLCKQPTVDKHSHCGSGHLTSKYPKSNLEKFSEEYFCNLDHYKIFCANRNDRLRRHAEAIEKYKQLKEGTHLLSLKVRVKTICQAYVREEVFKKLSAVKNPPSKFLNKDYFCEVCDLQVPASLGINHETELLHLYYCKKWEELEKYAADKRFFDPFQRVKSKIFCLLCGVYIPKIYFFSHLKRTLHIKRFDWYCTLKNEIPISSAIEIKPNLSAVCYLCDSLLFETINKREFRRNLKSLRSHWPCPAVIEQGIETKDSVKTNKDVEDGCLTSGRTQEAHKSDSGASSLNFKSLENAFKDTLDVYEGAIFEKVLDKTKSVIRQIEAATAERKCLQETACECKKPKWQCKCRNANGRFPKGGTVEEKNEKIETDHLKNDKTDDKEKQEEKKQEVFVTSGLRGSENLTSKLGRFGEIHSIQKEGRSAEVTFVEQGTAEKVAAGINLSPNNKPLPTMTVDPKEISEKKSKENNEIPESLEKCNFVKSKFPPLPSDLLKLLEQPVGLLDFVEELAAAAKAASESVEELEREKLLCSTINDAVVNLFPQCRCYPFGSRLSGLMFSNSDLDVFLDCGGMYEGMESLCPWPDRKLVHIVAGLLRKKKEITKLIIIDSARVPILSFHHKPTSINCDLSFKNGLSVHNTLLIKSLMSLNYQVKLVIIFFKYWVKRNGIHGQPFFSSYAITMMAIFYLQQLKPPMLPTVEELQNSFIGRRMTIGGWDCSFNVYAEGFAKKKGNFPFHVILQGLFSYYANFDYVKFAISPLDGKPLPREAFSTDGRSKLPMCYKRHILNFPQPLEKLVCQRIPICVFDPFDLSHVLTKSFTPTGLQMFKHFCQLSAKTLHESIKHLLISNGEDKSEM